MKKYSAILFSAFLMLHCAQEAGIKHGEEVEILFSLKNENDQRIDDSYQPRGILPLRLIIGESFYFENLDEQLIGMKELEEKDIKIPPQDAFDELGVYYLLGAERKYVVNPNDTLYLHLKVLKILRER